MAWWRLEASARSNRKLKSVGDSAAWLWACCGMYCAEQMTDGFVPQEELEDMARRSTDKQAAEKLVSAGLLHQTDGGVNVHDYLEYNMSREEAKRLSSVRSRAGRIGAMRKHGTCDKQVPETHATGMCPIGSDLSDRRSGTVDHPKEGSPSSEAGTEDHPKERKHRSKDQDEPGAAYLDTKALPNGLDNPDRVRRAFYLLWEKKYEVPYAQEPPKDRAWALALLKQHKAMGIQMPWVEWAPKIIAGYLDLDDDDLVKKDRHTMNHLTRKLNAIRANIGGAA